MMDFEARLKFVGGATGALFERAATLCQVAMASAASSAGSSDPEQVEDARRWDEFARAMAEVCVVLRDKALASFSASDSGLTIARPAPNGKILIDR